MRRIGKSLVLRAASGCLVAALAGCGGGGSPSAPSTPAPTPTPTVRSVVSSGSESGLSQNVLLFVPFTTSARGTLDVTVDWTIPADGIHIYVSANSCTLDQVNSSTCTYLAESAPSTVKPRLLTVAAVPAGAYTLYIGNRGPAEESVSWQIGLTTGGASSTAATARAVSAPTSNRWERQRRR